MEETRICECGCTEFEDGADGYFYCGQCQTQVQDMRDTAMGDEADAYGRKRTKSSRRHPAQYQVQASQFWRVLCVPGDNSYTIVPLAKLITLEDYANWVRTTYVMGIQLMIESQCQVMVEEFGVSPLILWLVWCSLDCFVTAFRVFGESWAMQMVEDSERQIKGNVRFCLPRSHDKDEPHNSAGERLVIIWLNSLQKTIPLTISLSICFLACHIAREPILPTDIVNWSLEEKLPYLNAFIKIREMFAEPSRRCPLSADLMFRPFRVVDSRVLESQAGSIAGCIGLELPPTRFFRNASMIFDWSMPPDLWLSPNRYIIPSRVCVMSIIMVAVRILYNINGYGKWKEKYCNAAALSSSTRRGKRKARAPKEPKKKTVRGSLYFQNCKSDSAELLGSLEMTYEKIREAWESSVNLSSYLELCKDVVFAGAP
ncbi:hypothetical protein MKX01_036896, partial [Papaver californicum]